jgi:hypothetical protein
MRLDSEVHPPRLAREADSEDAFERDDSEDRAAVVETRNAGVGVRVGHSMLRERPIGWETVREDKSKAGREGGESSGSTSSGHPTILARREYGVRSWPSGRNVWDSSFLISGSLAYRASVLSRRKDGIVRRQVLSP